MVDKELKLKVAEAIQDDVNKGIVRIDSGYLSEVDIKPGDIVEIEGERKTVAIADRSYPGDIGLNIIRMDGIIRKNAKTGIGEIVKIRKALVKEAKKVVIAPARKGIVIRASPEIFKQGLLGRAVVRGDIVSLGGAKRRKTTMMNNPFFDEDIFSILDESMMGIGFGDIKFVVVDTNPKQPVIILDQTEIEFRSEAVEIEEERVPDITYEDVGGLEDEIKKVREMVELPLKHPEIFERLGIEAPKGVLLHGPPGTGKTLLAKAVANETNSHFILINGPEIMSKYYGQSEENLRKKFEEAEKNAPSIIFIDEIDAIASKREETRGEVERRVVAQLLALMDGLQSRGKVVVIAATNVPNILDPALRRPGRFDREIEIGVPSKEGRLNILKIHTRNMPMYTKENIVKDSDFEPEYKEAILNILRYKDTNSRSLERTINKYLVENPEKNDLFKKIDISKLKKYMEKINYDQKIVSLKELAEITHGFVGADLASLAKEAAMIVLRKVLPDIKLKEDEPLPKELLEKLVLTQQDFKEALKVVRPSALREVLVEIPNVKWSDIGGLVNVKQELIEAVEWPLKHPESFKRLGVKPPKGILLFGAPGTGKTLLAKAVANESEANFILVKGPELLCISADTPIFTDFCGVRAIENFFENIKPYSTLEKKDGNIEVRNLNENFYTVGINAEGKTVKTRLTKATKLFVNEAYKVEFEDNNKIEVSKNQPFFVYRNGKIEWIKAEDLQINDFVAKPSSLITFDKEIKFIPPNYKHLRLAREDDDSYYVKIFSAHKLTKLPKKLTMELAEFLGWFAAEGNISKEQVCICNENPAYREIIRKLFEIFADKKSIKWDEGKIFVYSTPVVKFLEEIFEMKLVGKKSYTIKAPPIITKASKEMISAFLRGAFKGDGHIDDKKIEYGTMSKNFAQSMVYLLNQLPVKAKYWQRKDNMHMITISGEKEMNRFLRGVMGNNVIDGERKYYNAKYIIPDVSNLLKESKKILNLRYEREIPEGLFEGVISGRKHCGLLRVRKMMQYLEKYSTEEFKNNDIYKTLKIISDGDLAWTKVTNIEKANAQWMYDLETEDDSFVGGNLPLVLHNSKWVGESEKAVREVFKKARQVSPCIIFFDEVDALAPRRGLSSDSHVSERVVNQLLTEIDGLEDLHDVVVIAATNRPDIVDTALLRPGRFDRMILTHVPDENTRLEIFKVHTKGMPISVEEQQQKIKPKKMVAARTVSKMAGDEPVTEMELENEERPIFDKGEVKTRDDILKALAKKTDGYVGADIEAVCREAAILALREDINSREIYKKHFEKALEKVRPSITKDIEKAYEELQEHFNAARAKQMLDEKPGYMG